MAMAKEDVLTLLKIVKLTENHPRFGAITGKAYKDLMKVNAEMQELLDEEAKEEAEAKAEADAKAAADAKAKADADAKAMEDAAKAASTPVEEEDTQVSRRA